MRYASVSQRRTACDCSCFESSSAGSDSQAVSQSRNPTTPPVALVRDEEGFCISLISAASLHRCVPYCADSL